MCGDVSPQIRCHQCGSSQFMCQACDRAVHNNQPLHDREMWSDGIFKAVPPTTVCASPSDTEPLATQSMNHV